MYLSLAVRIWKWSAAGKGDKSVYETELEIRTVRRPQVKVTAATLEVGKSWKETVAMPGATGTNQLTLEVSDIAPVNVSSRLSYLLGYPHGCLEQITSKGFPQLYISSFTDLTLQQAKSTEEAVKEVIRRLRSYQTVDGVRFMLLISCWKPRRKVTWFPRP